MLLKDHERAVLTALMFERGLIPIDNTSHDMSRALDQLTPEDARKLKRKFRKVWRRLARQEALKMGRKEPETWMKQRYGAGKTNPSRVDREARKRAVQEHFYRDLTRPLLDKFEKSGKTRQGPT